MSSFYNNLWVWFLGVFVIFGIRGGSSMCSKGSPSRSAAGITCQGCKSARQRNFIYHWYLGMSMCTCLNFYSPKELFHFVTTYSSMCQIHFSHVITVHTYTKMHIQYGCCTWLVLLLCVNDTKLNSFSLGRSIFLHYDVWSNYCVFDPLASLGDTISQL